MSTDSHQAPGRRDFIRVTTVLIGTLVGAVIGVPSIAYLVSPALGESDEDVWIELGPLDNYPIGPPTRFEIVRTRVNGWERTAVTYGGYVVREDETKSRVFSNICTHLGCRVSWHPDIRHFISPCHDGHFDILGDNISGPPPRPLDEFATRIEGGILYIELPAFERTT